MMVEHYDVHDTKPQAIEIDADWKPQSPDPNYRWEPLDPRWKDPGAVIRHAIELEDHVEALENHIKQILESRCE